MMDGALASATEIDALFSVVTYTLHNPALFRHCNALDPVAWQRFVSDYMALLVEYVQDKSPTIGPDGVHTLILFVKQINRVAHTSSRMPATWAMVGRRIFELSKYVTGITDTFAVESCLPLSNALVDSRDYFRAGQGGSADGKADPFVYDPAYACTD